jgi:hypothetical protein
MTDVPVWVVRVGDQLFARSRRRYGDTYVAPMTGPQAKAATVQIKPADSDTGRNNIR